MNRTVLAAALDWMVVPELVMSVRRMVSPWLTVLTYHRVARPDAAATLDDGVVDVTPEQLDRQLAFVGRWFRPIGMDDLLAHVRGHRSLPRNPLLVTFDDGYRDNHDVALPILARHGVRATFFIATDYVDRRRLFWWDRVALLVKRSPRERIAIDYPERFELPIHAAPTRSAAIRSVQRLIKDSVGLDLDRFIDGLERASGVAFESDDERRLVDETVMTWDQIIALRRAGMDVHSHTRTHRVLQSLNAALLADELRGSRAVLEEVLGEPVRALSYPVGKPVSGVAHIRQAVCDAGYELGFSNGTGFNLVQGFDPFDTRRVSAEVALGDSFFRAMLAIPYLAY
jgi:peptidoglycan/xylan/chitin deacetylase (PgdA/CDA1 family)